MKAIAPLIVLVLPIASHLPLAIAQNPLQLALVETTAPWFDLVVLSLFILEAVSFCSVLGCAFQSLRLHPSMPQQSLAMQFAAFAFPSWPFH